MRIAAILSGLLLAAPAFAGSVGTFTLDGLSFVSFGDDEIVRLPAGATLRFRFGEPATDGSVAFTIQPGDVAIESIPLASGGRLQYAFAKTAAGTMRTTSEGRRIQFTATVRATLADESTRDGSQEYVLAFTTEAAAASDRSRRESLNVTGMRLADGTRYAQIVGATTNRADAYPEPGAAVYAVLSGTFDRVP